MMENDRHRKFGSFLEDVYAVNMLEILHIFVSRLQGINHICLSSLSLSKFVLKIFKNP